MTSYMISMWMLKHWYKCNTHILTWLQFSGLQDNLLERKNKQFLMDWDLNLKDLQHILENLYACLFAYISFHTLMLYFCCLEGGMASSRQLVMSFNYHQENELISTMLKSKVLLYFPKFNCFVPTESIVQVDSYGHLAGAVLFISLFGLRA